jgi:glycosyltransferase involved in cell wall biosynthesis
MLIRAFAQLATDFSNVTLAIAGDGPKDLVRELKLLATNLGVADRIEWLGFVGSDVKKQVLSEASIFVLPSASENYGVAVVEAMAAGIPVVVSVGVGVGEIVQDAQAGRIFDGTVGGLALTLRSLLRDRTECARMAAAGQRVVREQLSMSSFGQNLEQLYAAIQHASPRI